MGSSIPDIKENGLKSIRISPLLGKLSNLLLESSSIIFLDLNVQIYTPTSVTMEFITTWGLVSKAERIEQGNWPDKCIPIFNKFNETKHGASETDSEPNLNMALKDLTSWTTSLPGESVGQTKSISNEKTDIHPEINSYTEPNGCQSSDDWNSQCERHGNEKSR